MHTATSMNSVRLLLPFVPVPVAAARCVALAKHGLTPAGPGQAGPSGLRGAASTAEMDKYYRGQVSLLVLCGATLLVGTL